MSGLIGSELIVIDSELNQLRGAPI